MGPVYGTPAYIVEYLTFGIMDTYSPHRFKQSRFLRTSTLRTSSLGKDRQGMTVLPNDDITNIKSIKR